MNKFARSVLYVLTIAAVLMTSALGTTTVYAEDGPTADPPPEDPALSEPPTEDPVITEPPVEDPVVTEPAVEDPVITESPQIEETTSLTQENQNPPEDPVTVPEILEQVPENTDLVVVNDEGTAEPLASQEASEILKKGDPVWCPAGQVPGDSGCSGSHDSFDDLIVDLRDNDYSGDGVIWVEANYDRTQDTSPIVFDHTNGDLAQLNNLTIIGGWDGNAGSTTDPNNPSILDDRLFINNWQSNVTIYNLEFDGAVDGSSSLQVRTEGHITLENVSISGNTAGSGADLYNRNVSCTTCGDITVKNSSFSDNADVGLDMNSSGDITVIDVNAENNGGSGIYLETEGGDSNTVNIKDTEATGNGEEGIYLEDVEGNITIKNSTASDNVSTSINHGDGIRIENTDADVTIENSTASNNVSSSDNHGDGIRIDNVGGNVTIKGTTTNDNHDDGIEINDVGGNVTVEDAKVSGNGDDGVELGDFSGHIQGNATLKDLDIDNNLEDNIDIDYVDGDVTLESITTKNSVNNDGVDVDNSSGNVTGKYITSTGNAGDGVEIDDIGGNLYLSHVTSNNNVDDGFDIEAIAGYIKISCSSGSWNLSKGAIIEATGEVILKCSQFNGNAEDGIHIPTASSLKLYSVVASGNVLLDQNIGSGIPEVIIETVECCCYPEKEEEEPSYFGSLFYTILVCTAPDTNASLTNPGGNQVLFNNLCGYKAGIFDGSSEKLPKYVPGGEEYITPLYKMIKDLDPEKPADPKKDTSQKDTYQEYKGMYEKVFDGLPDVLPEGDQYQDSLLVVVLDENGKFLDPLPEGADITVMFKIPDGLADDAELAILRWDGLDWEDLGGVETEDGLYFKTTADAIGVFVLVVR